MDASNTFKQHLIVGIFTVLLVLIFNSFLDVPLAASFGRVSFILLFLVLLIGPVMKLKKPTIDSSPLENPWSWRGELGIWFFITGLIHFMIILTQRSFLELIKIGGSGYALSNFIGLVALIIAFLLTVTSFHKTIIFIGIESWRWLHSMTYVIFYLLSAHFIYFQFFSTHGDVGPDWFGFLAVILAITIIVLQISAFIFTFTFRTNRRGL